MGHLLGMDNSCNLKAVSICIVSALATSTSAAQLTVPPPSMKLSSPSSALLRTCSSGHPHTPHHLLPLCAHMHCMVEVSHADNLTAVTCTVVAAHSGGQLVWDGRTSCRASRRRARTLMARASTWANPTVAPSPLVI